MRPALRQILSSPGWGLPYNPDIQFDFARGVARKGPGAVVPSSSLITVSRASTAMVDDLKGQWRAFPANTLARSDKGAFDWESRTNLALWCRDLTNAAWAKVTMTAALTATGIDGAANSATTITATGASSTILQTVVQASTADTVSFFVRRRTGTGTVEVTADGAAFTDITAALATAATATPGGWYRAAVSATLVNPVFGLRITTSGDAVDVDFAKLEASTFVGPPILTTTVAVTQAADSITVSTGATPTFGAAYSLLGGVVFPSAIPASTFPNVAAITSGSTTNKITISSNSSSHHRVNVTSGGVSQWDVNAGGSIAVNVRSKFALSAAAANFESAYNGTAGATQASGSMPVGPIDIGVGKVTGVTTVGGRYITDVAVWATAKLASGELVRITSP